MNSSLNRLQYILFLLLPISLVSGPFLPDLFIVIIGLTFFYQCYLLNDWSLFNTIYVKVFLIWCIFIIFSSILSSDPYLSLESSLFYFRHGLFALAVVYILRNNKNAKKYFFYSLLITIFILIIDSFYQYISGVNITNDAIINNRLSSLFGDELILGAFLSKIIPLFIALSFIFYKKSNSTRIFAIAFFLLCSILIFLSGERSAFINLLLFYFIIFFLIEGRKLKLLFISIGIIVSIILILFSNQNLKNRMIDYTIWQTKSSFTFSLHHDLIYETAFNMFLDNPIMGVGPKLFRKLCSDPLYFKDSQNYLERFDDPNLTGCSTHPHHIYLQLLAETGIVGAVPLFFVLMLISYIFLKRFYYNIRGIPWMNDYQLIILCGIYVNISPFTPSLNFFHNWSSIITFLYLGFMYNTLVNNNKKNNG